MQLYAHFDKDKNKGQLLFEHLDNVAKNMCITFNRTNFTTISNDNLKTLLSMIGYYHDIGKSMKAFQDYLKGKLNNDKNHSYISAAIFVKMCKSLCIDSKLIYLSFLTILNHHGEMKLPENTYGYEWNSIEQKWILCKKELSKANFTIPHLELNNKIKLADVQDLILEKHSFTSKRSPNPEWFFILQYLFSKLICADKLDSAEINTNNKSIMVSPYVVDEYIKRKIGNNEKVNLDDTRNIIKQSIIKKIQSLSDDDIKKCNIFTITAPTGSGKTLTSLSAVLHLCERINKIYGYSPKIITAIPFVNIIEQTKLDYIEIFKDKKDVLVHHSLSNNNDVQSDKPLKDSLLLAETWDSDVILTTFVRFFSSIFSGKNKNLLKLNKLEGSVVVLDEVQALPDKYYPLIGATLKLISQYYGTKFILMTATQPKIIEYSKPLIGDIESTEPIELLDNYTEFFENLKRTKIIPVIDKVNTTEQLVGFINETKPKNKSALVVVNTIGRSIEVYNELKKYHNTLYLSTNIIPADRIAVIKLAKKMLENQTPFIMVSTQTIEAGVDLDFDIGYRDLAPLTSIIQTAGRVNREGKKRDFAPVYIFKLEKDSSYIYKFIDIAKTQQRLTDVITEDKYSKLISDYYDDLIDGISVESSNIWNDGVLKLNYGEIEKFELIDSKEAVDILIEKNNKATELIQSYCDLSTKLKNDFSYDTKAELNRIYTKLSNYFVSVKANKLKSKPCEFKAEFGIDAPFYIVTKSNINRYYNETGYIVDNKDAFIY